MDEQRYQQHLLNIPKTEPFKICWCCITETSGLLKINDVSDFSFLYKSIADFEIPHELDYNHVCITCIQSLRQCFKFKDMLRNSVVAWRTYLNKAGAQRDEATVQFPVIDIKKEFNEYEQPVAIFLECEYLQSDNKDDIDRTVDNLVYEYDNVEIKSEIFVKPSETTIVKQRIQTPGSSEVCLKDVNYSSHILKNRPFLNCAHCSMRYKTKKSMLKHLQTFHSDKSRAAVEISCRICRKIFESLQSLRKHIRTSHKRTINTIKQKNSVAGTCEICFRDVSHYNRHISRHKVYFTCAHCYMSFKSRETLLKHLQTAHINYVSDEKPFCSICQQEYPSYECLRRHIKNVHYTINKTACPVCQKSFASRNRYMQHKRTHKEKTIQCPKCPKKFIEPGALNIHISTHNPDNHALCELCGFTTKHKYNMKRHILGVHANTKQKRYITTKAHCSLCNENFSHFRTFLKHLNEKHADLAEKMLQEYRSENKLKCQWCNRKFSSLEQLEEHNRENIEKHRHRILKHKEYLRKHKQNLNVSRTLYTCDICKNSFNSQRVLDAHIANHSKEPRPFKCDICGATYRRSSDMLLHTQRVHTKERPFSCDKCDYRCLTRPELNSHNKWRHKIKQQ